MNYSLSPRMQAALSRLYLSPVSPWCYGFGWGTYKALYKRGLVKKITGQSLNDTVHLTALGKNVAFDIREARAFPEIGRE